MNKFYSASYRAGRQHGKVFFMYQPKYHKSPADQAMMVIRNQTRENVTGIKTKLVFVGEDI